MALAGWGSILLGGCPLRQLILAGEGNGDSAVTVFGMIVGAAFGPQLRPGRQCRCHDRRRVHRRRRPGCGPRGRDLGLAVVALISVATCIRRKSAND